MSSPSTRRRWPAILVLAAVAPFSAEISIGDLPFTLTGLVALIFFIPIYAAGAILIRELVVRRGSGLPGLLLLGMAYCLVEEGLALHSLTSPTIYNGIGVAMGGRIGGVNGVYLLLQLVNHPIWSIIVPVVITDLIFPAHRNRPYLRVPGLIITPLVYLVGVALTALSAPTIDPGYRMPYTAVIILLVIVAVLAVITLGPLAHLDRRTAPAAKTYRSAASPTLVLIISVIAAWIFLAPLWLPGHFRWSFAGGSGVLVMIIVAMSGAAGYLLVLHRWGALHAGGAADRPDWTAAHRAAAVSGLLLAHSVLGAVIQPGTVRDRIGVVALVVISAALLGLLIRRAGDDARPLPASTAGRRRAAG